MGVDMQRADEILGRYTGRDLMRDTYRCETGDEEGAANLTDDELDNMMQGRLASIRASYKVDGGDAARSLHKANIWMGIAVIWSVISVVDLAGQGDISARGSDGMRTDHTGDVVGHTGHQAMQGEIDRLRAENDRLRRDMKTLSGAYCALEERYRILIQSAAEADDGGVQ